MKIEISLDGKWFFKSFSTDNKLNFSKIDCGETKSWEKGSVPGSVQGDLLKSGKVPDPFFERGAEEYRWIEQKEWWYQKEFNLPEELDNRRVYIRFEGLDTIAVIYLNGREVGKTQNMFTSYEFKVTDFLIPGKNRLLVKLEPVLKVTKGTDGKGIIDFTKIHRNIAPDIRKATFAYGGDMSQRMVTTGIWKPVKIIGYDEAIIRDCQITSKLKDKKAAISLNIEIEKLADKDIQVNLRVRLKGKKILKDTSFVLKEDKKTVKVSFQIDNPNLWWPNGMGEQNLYSIEVELMHKGKVLDAREDRFGIREVKLLQEKDKAEGGKTFTFVINGVKVFAKGAGWVPADTLMSPVSRERYRKLIKLAKEANFNMLRVHGFGIYEDEEFYKLCDEMGIMIWQDFMFANSRYSNDNKEFLKECEREAEINVKKLRNHPCVVLWCGNNEVQMGFYVQDRKPPVPGEKIFHKILPEVCKRLDPTRPYWPSSAWSAPGKFPLWKKMGDYHFYPVSSVAGVGSKSCGGWEPTRHPYGKRILLPLSLENTSYRRYAKEKAKFYSEFGLASIPSIESMKKITDDNLWPIENNPIWEYHFAPSWPKPVRRCIEVINLLNSEFGDSKDINDFILYSQISQATTLKFAIEHFRARKFSCSGALFWHYNACWPTLSMDVVDYYLDKKIAYYWVKKAFSPLLITFIEAKKGYLEVWIVNDLLTEVKGKFALSKIDFKGKVSLNEKKR